LALREFAAGSGIAEASVLKQFLRLSSFEVEPMANQEVLSTVWVFPFFRVWLKMKGIIKSWAAIKSLFPLIPNLHGGN
jgi:hypothetical protein